MSLFLKVHASLHGYEQREKNYAPVGEADSALQHRYIDVTKVTDIVEGGTRAYTDDENNEQTVEVTHLYILYSPPTIVNTGEHKGSVHLEHHVAYFEADGKMADIMAQIEALRPGTCDKDDAPAPAPGISIVSLSSDYPFRITRDGQSHGVSAATDCTKLDIPKDAVESERIIVPAHGTLPSSATTAIVRIQNHIAGKNVVLSKTSPAVRHVIRTGGNLLLYANDLKAAALTLTLEDVTTP